MKLTRDEELALWRQVQEKLTCLRSPVSLSHVDQLLTTLPQRQEEESISDWLRRGTQCFFKPITEIIRLAAASTSTAALPEQALESIDEQFRLHIIPKSGKLMLKVTALGFAADTFAHQQIGITSSNTLMTLTQANDTVMQLEVRQALLNAMPGLIDQASTLIVTLDEEGDGHCEVADQPEIRELLLRPVIGLVTEKPCAKPSLSPR